MVDNPIPTVALVIMYLATVLVIGPYWMRDRKPFKLKNTLIYYNAFQVLLSGYMFYEVIIVVSMYSWIIGSPIDFTEPKRSPTDNVTTNYSPAVRPWLHSTSCPAGWTGTTSSANRLTTAKMIMREGWVFWAIRGSARFARNSVGRRSSADDPPKPAKVKSKVFSENVLGN